MLFQKSWFIAIAFASLAFGCAAGEDIRSCLQWELRHFLTLAEMSRLSYDDSQPGLERGASGCVLLVRRDEAGNSILAVRGTVIVPQAGEKPPRFKALRPKQLKKTYQDWAETNIKQAAGFLPKQYLEAVAMVRDKVLALPEGKYVFITGHSKGGGAAEYAAVAIQADASIPADKKARVFCVTFNAAIVRRTNWERLFRKYPEASADGLRRVFAEPGKLVAITMAGDPVSTIASDDRGFFGRHIVIDADKYMDALELHDISTIILQLSALVKPAAGQ